MSLILPAEKNSERKSANSIISQADIAALALEDYSIFFEHVLMYDERGRGIPPHQQKWCDDLQENKKVMIVAPACHGKTTVDLGYALWRIARDRKVRVGIFTNSDPLAEGILEEIKGHLEDNEKLKQFYGQFKPWKPSKWNKCEIRVEGGAFELRQKDVTVRVGGAMSSWKGIRLDVALADDLVDERNSDTPQKCDDLIKWFWETLSTRLEPWGEVKIVGTPENENDLYHDLRRNPRGFKLIHDQAIINEPEHKVLWPEKFTYEYLAGLRSDNHQAFMKHYQGIVTGSEASKISQEQIDACFDHSIGMYPHGLPAEIRSQFKYILAGVDPAWTKNKRSKYSVIMTVGIRHDGRRQILDIFREQVEYDNLFGWIQTKYGMLLPQHVIVETNQLQERLRQEVANKAIPTIASFTTGAKNDLNVGIPMVYSLITANKLILPAGDGPSRHLSQQFINEILSWPAGAYTDILMAYYLIEQEIRRRTAHAVKVVPRSAITGRPVHLSRFSRHYGLR